MEAACFIQIPPSPGPPSRHARVDSQCHVPHMTTGAPPHPTAGLSSWLTWSKLSQWNSLPVEFALAMKRPGDCDHWNGATYSCVPERMGTPDVAGIPEWCYLLFSRRSTELETIRTMGRSVCDMSILTHSFFPSSLTIKVSNKLSTSLFFCFFPPTFPARIRCKSESYLQWKDFS